MKLKLSEQEFNLPMRWEEITIAQFFAMQKLNKENVVEYTCGLLAILTGIEYDKWYNASEFDVAEKILTLLNEWINIPPDFSNSSAPKELIIAGKAIEIPHDIKLKTWAQKLVFQDLIKNHWIDAANDVGIDFMPMAIAIYLLPDKFTDKAASEYSELISKEMLLFDGVAISRFFLTNFLKYSSSNPTTLVAGMIQKKSMPESKTSKSLAHYLRFGSTPKKSV